MLGNHIGELNVYIKQGLDNDLVWSKNDTQGNVWHKAQIQLSPMVDTFKVILVFCFIHNSMSSLIQKTIKVVKKIKISYVALNASSFSTTAIYEGTL